MMHELVICNVIKGVIKGVPRRKAHLDAPWGPKMLSGRHRPSRCA